MIFCRAAPWRCRMVMKSFQSPMNCSDASTSSSRLKIGIRPTTAASPQTTRERSRVTASFSTGSSKSYGRSIVFKTRTVPSSPLYSTPAASPMFSTRAPSGILIVTVRFSTTPIDDTPVLVTIWRSARKEIYLMGLALDYCVKYSALDARHLGLNTNVIVDGCRGIGLEPDDIDRALDEMKRAGATILKSSDL